MSNYRMKFVGSVVLLILLGFFFGLLIDIPTNEAPLARETTIDQANDNALLYLWVKLGATDLRIATLLIAVILFVAIFSTLYLHFERRNDEHE